jgi:hypothetical protein
MSYAEAKQIRLNAAAQGYGIGSDTYNSAVDFGQYAQSKYMINPNDSAAMFQEIVVKAGASADQLRGALDTLAVTALRTGSSFIGLQQAFQGNMTTATSQLGLSGGFSTAYATALTSQIAGGGAILNGAQGEAQFADSMIGQAMIASQLGTNVQGLAAYGAGYGGTGTAGGNAANMVNATNAVAAKILGQHGITKQLLDSNYNAFTLQCLNAKYALQMILPIFGFTASPPINCSDPAFVEWCKTMVSGAASTTNTNTPISAPGAANALSGGQTNNFTSSVQSLERGGAGQGSELQSLMSKVQSSSHWSNVGFDVGGKYVSMGELQSMDSSHQQAFIAQVIAGNITLAQGNAQTGAITKGGLGGSNTLLDMLGHASSQNYLSSNNVQGALQLELSGAAAQFFKILSNPKQFQQWLDGWKNNNGGK